MPDSDDDDMPAAPLSMMVGDLRGRMRAHEMRMDRHETWVGEKFTSLETKVDRVVSSIADIKDILSSAAGGRAVVKFLLPFALAAFGTGLTIASAVFLHILKVN